MIYDQWKQMMGGTNAGSMPFPYLESLTCPSDITTTFASVLAPTSYVVNCGQADLTPIYAGTPSSSAAVGPPTIPPDYAANGSS